MAEGRSEFPGYYPGSPIYRQPRSFKSYKTPEWFQPGMADEFFESIKQVPDYATRIPRWMWMHEVDSIKGLFTQFSADDFSASVSSESIQEFSAEELEELPGAKGIAFNYNPVEWVKDPKEMVKWHMKQHWNAITDRQDFKQGVQRSFWSKELTSRENSPYYIEDDTYTGVKEKLPHFMSNSASAFSRNDAYNKLNMEVLSSLNREIHSKSRTVDSSGHISESRKYDRFSAQDKKALDNFSAQVSVAESMTSLDKSIGGFKKGFDAGYFRTKAADKDTMDSNYKDLVRDLGKAEDAIDQLKKSKLTAAEVKTYETFKRKQAGTLSGKITAEEDAVARKVSRSLDKEVKSYESFVSGLKKQVDGSFERNVAVGRWELKSTANKNKLYNEFNVQSGKLFNKSIDGGLGGAYIRKVSERNVRNRKSKLNSALSSKDASGYITSAESRKMGLITGAASRTWEWRSTWDLVQDFDKGKLPTQFIYNRLILPRIERFTPHYYMKKWFFAKYTDSEGNTQYKRRIVNFFEGANKDHTFKMNIKGAGSVIINGGAHFGMDVTMLNRMLSKTGGTSNLLGLLNNDGGTFDAFSKTMSSKALGKMSLQMRKTRAWLIKHGKVLGLEIDPATKKFINSAKNQQKLESLFKGIRDRKLDPTEFDPSLKSISRHGQYSRMLAKLQKSVFGKVYKYTFKTWDAVAEKLIDVGGRLLEKVFGAATGPVGAAVAWVARIALVYVVQKSVKQLTKGYEALKKGDFNFFENAVQEVFVFIAKTVGALGVGCVLIILPPILAIQAILGAFSPVDSSRAGGTYVDKNAVALPQTNYYTDPTCGGPEACPNPPSECVSQNYGYYVCITPEDLPGGGQEQY